MVKHNLKRGDPVIFRKSKHTARPGRRAQRVVPEPLGEFYTYEVDKFWVVTNVDRDSGTVEVMTRRGKRHVIRSTDPRLRCPSWWEWFRFASRFPKLPERVAAHT
jgi:hypothetical protein